MIGVGESGNVYLRINWDSSTERRWYHEARLKVMCEPKLLKALIVKPSAVLLGETTKAPKYYPDFLVQTPDSNWWIVEVKGAVVTPTWKKVRRIIEDRIACKSLLVQPDGDFGPRVPAGLMVAYWIKKEWHYDYVEVPK